MRIVFQCIDSLDFKVIATSKVCCRVCLLWIWNNFQHSGAGVRFTLNGTTYQNNSLVTLEGIGEGDYALHCVTDLTACCRRPYALLSLGNWFFPNGTRVPSSGFMWDIDRTRGHMVVFLHHRRGGVTGIYSCVIPDGMNVNQTIYIGVYTASSGEWYIYIYSCSVQLLSHCSYCRRVRFKQMLFCAKRKC